MNFTKHDGGKPRMGLIPPEALLGMADVLTFGAQKYDDDNWRKCDRPERYLDAALRHIVAHMAGEIIDPE